MTLKELMMEEGRKHGFPEKVLNEASFYSDAVSGQGKRVRALLNQDLPDEFIEIVRAYIASILSQRNNPEVRVFLNEERQKQIEKN